MMKTLLGTVAVVSASVVIGLLLWSGPERLDAAPKSAPGPAVYAPATVLEGEIVRVSVFNDDPAAAVDYVIQLGDVLTGVIVYEQTVGPVQPLTGVVLDHDPHGDRSMFVIVSGSAVSGPHLVNLSSVQIFAPTTSLIKFIPASSHTYGSGTGAH